MLTPTAEAIKQTATVALMLAGFIGGSHWLAKKLKKPVLDLICCILLGLVIAFTVGAWMWSVKVGGSL